MLPVYTEIEIPLLKELALRGGASKPSDLRLGKTVYVCLAEHFSLTKEDLDQDVYDSYHHR